MNVTSTESQACASPGAATITRDACGGPANVDDAALFFGLLTQAATSPGAAAPALATMAVAAELPPEDADTDEAPVDWILPFLPPVPGTTPQPLDLELPGPDPAGDASLAGVGAAGDDGPVVPLPRLIDNAIFSKDRGSLVAADPAPIVDASGSAAVATAPRVEAAGNGAAQAVVRHIPVPMGDGRWPERVGHEVRILVERGVQAATLRLTPEHLGPVDVRIDIVNDKANVVFGAAHADTRAALTDAIPKLREMFAGAGLTLGDAGVRQDHASGFAGSGPRHLAAATADDGDAGEPVAAARAARLSLVDAYA